MMDTKLLHFVDVKLAASEDAAIVMRIIHGYNSQHGNHLGVDTPEWSGLDSAYNVRLVRVFGLLDALSELVNQKPFQRIALMGGSSLTPVLIKFTAGTTYTRLSRANTHDRSRKSSLDRLRRRAEARGEIFTVKREIKDDAFILNIPTRSLSTGQTFLLKIQKEKIDICEMVEFNAYGLSKSGGVPSF